MSIVRRVFCVMLLALVIAAAPLHAADKVYTYTVTGTIRQLPSKPGGELFVRHDPIPDYVGSDGKVVGMHAMTMPFWLAEGVSLEGYEVGDKVQFTLESRWEPKPSDVITAIKKLG